MRYIKTLNQGKLKLMHLFRQYFHLGKDSVNKKFQTPTTPNVLGIFSFAFLCNRFLEFFQNIKNSEHNTKKKAIFLYDFFDTHKDFKPFITDKKSKSETIIVIEGTLEKIRQKKEELMKNNILVGSGYSLNKETQIRIAISLCIQ